MVLHLEITPARRSVRRRESAALLAFGLVICLVGAQVARAAPESWTLAMTWRPGFCAMNASAAECIGGQSTNLILHGLWPEGASEAECVAAGRARAAWCQMPAVAVSPATQQALDAVMPGRAACLDRHEWARHGACSSMSQDAYFRLAAELARKANGLKIARRVASAAGKTVHLEDLRRAAAQDFGAAADAVTWVCRRYEGETHFIEMRFALGDGDLSQFPAPAALRAGDKHGHGGCPASGLITIDAMP